MPTGSYHHLCTDGSVRLIERFSCAPGPSGWRYVSRLSTPDGPVVGSVDVTLDDRGRQLRVDLTAAGWNLRGGRSGAELLWVRRPVADPVSEIRELRQDAAGFIGDSPAFLLAAAAATGPGDDPVRLRLVRLDPALAARRVDEKWHLLDTADHPGELAVLRVSTYRRVDLETGEHDDLHLSGDVVLDAPGIALAELESAPNDPMLRPR